MVEHNHTIFSSFSLPSASLTEEYTGEMDKNNEFLFENSKIFSDILAWTDNDDASSTSVVETAQANAEAKALFSDILAWTDNDDASSTSSMDSTDSEMGILDNNETVEKDEIIDRIE